MELRFYALIAILATLGAPAASHAGGRNPNPGASPALAMPDDSRDPRLSAGPVMSFDSASGQTSVGGQVEFKTTTRNLTYLGSFTPDWANVGIHAGWVGTRPVGGYFIEQENSDLRIAAYGGSHLDAGPETLDWNIGEAGIRLNQVRGTETIAISPAGWVRFYDRGINAGESELTLSARRQLAPWLEVTATANAGILWAGARLARIETTSAACTPPTETTDTSAATDATEATTEAGDPRCVDGYFESNSAARPTQIVNYDPYANSPTLETLDLLEPGLRQNGFGHIESLSLGATAKLGEHWRLNAAAKAEHVSLPLEQYYRFDPADYDLEDVEVHGPDAPDLEGWNTRLSVSAEYQF